MKIAFLSAFNPFRGGISQFNTLLLRALAKKNTVDAFNFKRQYPNFLFPGTSQYVTADDVVDEIDSTALLDTINPFSYVRTSRAIQKGKYELLLTRYWMTFFAPSLGFVTGRFRKKAISIAILDNVIPHEKRFFDAFCNRYFLTRNDGFVVMSDQVLADLLSIKPNAKYIRVAHPVYNQFGDLVARSEAAKYLALDPTKKTLLFFGLIRAYKGLDILLEAFSVLPSDYQLVIAGESYEDFSKYDELIDRYRLRERILIHNRYISDREVRYYFSAADVCILPYKTATQSGISGIAANFNVPSIVTNVGGLKDYIEDGKTGILVDLPEAKILSEAILDYFDQNKFEEFSRNIQEAKGSYSWDMLAEEIVDFYEKLRSERP